MGWAGVSEGAHGKEPAERAAPVRFEHEADAGKRLQGESAGRVRGWSGIENGGAS
jgi:hypothetical protein